MRNQVIRIVEAQAVAVAAAVRNFLAVCRARNLSKNTVAYYSYRLTAFERFLAAKAEAPTVDAVKPSDVRDFLTHEAEANSASTSAHSYIALSAFFNFLAAEGFVQTNPMQRVTKPKRPQRIIPTFSTPQIEQLFAACAGRGFLAVRDRAILCLLLDSGLRASELCGLSVGDVSLEAQHLRVVGKGDKERIVPFGKAARQALLAYYALRERVSDEDPADDAPFFITSLGEPMTRHGLRAMLKARAKQAGISGVRVSPHTMRHTAAVTYLRRGGDAFSLQKLLGHSDLTMTRKYCELSEQDVQEKHRLFSPADGLLGKAKNGRKRIR